MDKVSAVFTESFLEKNKDLNDIEQIFAAVVAEDPSITREEFDLFVDTLPDPPAQGEISEADLDNVSGGIAITIAGCYIAGMLIGEAIYYYRSRKRR